MTDDPLSPTAPTSPTQDFDKKVEEILAPSPKRTRAKKPAPPAPKRRAAGLLSHESHTRDIPAVAAELGLPVHTVRSIVMRAIQDWQAQNPVRELVRLHFETRLGKPAEGQP